MPSLNAFFDRFKQDLRYGVRMLWSKPGFTAVSVLSIALGIGATTAIFSVVYAVLIDPYPYRAADRIGSVILTSKKDPHWNTNYTTAQYDELKARVRSMEDVVAMDRTDDVMTGTGLAQAVVRSHCSANFFDFFGVPTLFGRAFTAKDQRRNAAPDPVAVISYKFWQSAFQGRPDVLGQKIRINDDVYTITGVLPIRFTWMDVDAYVPMDAKPAPNRYFNVFYRIRPGVSQEQVNAEFQPILEQFRRQVPRYMYPEDAFKTKFVNVNDGILGKFATTLLVLFGAVTLLLLIGCGNVANLLLARAATREGEMAIRVSIGATRMRLVRQLLTESVLLALAGGVFGIALAYVGVRAVITLMPEYSTPHEAVIALNWPVLWFAVGASILTGIIFGLAPALQASGETQAETLRGSGRGTSVGARRRRLHDSLMVAEITLSLVLLTGAGMAVRGLLLMQNQSLGYNPKHALTFLMPLSEGRYTQWASRLALYQNVANKLRRAPQVEAAAISATGTPPYNGFQARAILDDRPAAQAPDVRVTMVQDGYLAAVGTHLLRGRDLTESDILQGRAVAVITEDMVKRDFSGGKEPIGHHIVVDIFNESLPPQMLKAPHFTNSFEIVGVAATARNRGLNNPPMPAMFIPYSILLPTNAFLIARTSGDPNSLIGPGREAVRAVDRNQPITLTRTLEGWLNTATAYQSFSTFLFGVFGAVGMLLAAAGVFSVVSYSVEHRTREFGIRMALGANPRDVLKLVLASTGRLLALGLVVGLALSILASRTLANQMEGMGTGDPLVFVLVPAVLIIATLVAAFLPARSATRIPPMEALRHD
ncbi:MAG TPA: ABC transporter permease [Bryobacteraceae bacterium]|jgi:predicted permease